MHLCHTYTNREFHFLSASLPQFLISTFTSSILGFFLFIVPFYLSLSSSFVLYLFLTNLFKRAEGRQGFVFR